MKMKTIYTGGMVGRILKNKQEESVIPAKTEMTIKIVWFIFTIMYFT